MLTPIHVPGFTRIHLVFVLSLFFWNGFAFADEPDQPRNYSILATARVQSTPPQIRLQWVADPVATQYEVGRKSAADPNWIWLASLPGDATEWLDKSVQTGTSYEYQLRKTAPKYTGYGYLSAGIELPLVEDRGKLILLVDESHDGPLDSELKTLEQDLIGDGWLVKRHSIQSSATPESVRALVQTEYLADPRHVEAVFLFGRIPVPYSGSISPDGHTNHFGAWPADVFYGDMTGLWTDSSVTATNAERTRNWNVPGDGKYDQNTPAGIVRLQVGRVDFSDMTCYSNKTPPRSERDLLRAYLAKDHAYRQGLFPDERRAIMCDNFFDKGRDPVGATGWRNFAGLVGPTNIVEVGWSNYFPNVSSNFFLWSFGSGGGQYFTCTGVGSSDDFALQEVQTVFTLWLGSYFGDWDNESNFLRAALGGTYTLASCYAGFPHWLLHPMETGATLGQCARLTQNNRARGIYPPFNPGAGQVHIALLGDPTLRLHFIRPPSELTTAWTTNGVRLAWSRSADVLVAGYHLYRRARADEPFSRVNTGDPVTATSYTDHVRGGPYQYLVRAVRLEQTPTGSYWNASTGALADTGEDPYAPRIRIAGAGSDQITLRISGPAGLEAVLEASRDLLEWVPLATNRLTGQSYEVQEPLGTSDRAFYRLR